VLGTPAEPFVTAASVSVGCAIVIAKHYENIGRLLRGTESRFESGRGGKGAATDGPVVAHADEGR
jgi:hypothetical protein